VSLTKFLNERENLICVFLFEFEQVLEKLVKNFGEKKALLYGSLSKE
jgi:hypothetical protein